MNQHHQLLLQEKLMIKRTREQDTRHSSRPRLAKKKHKKKPR
jgi:hypothetical protein